MVFGVEGQQKPCQVTIYTISFLKSFVYLGQSGFKGRHGTPIAGEQITSLRNLVPRI